MRAEGPWKRFRGCMGKRDGGLVTAKSLVDVLEGRGGGMVDGGGAGAGAARRIACVRGRFRGGDRSGEVEGARAGLGGRLFGTGAGCAMSWASCFACAWESMVVMRCWQLTGARKFQRSDKLIGSTHQSCYG